MAGQRQAKSSELDTMTPDPFILREHVVDDVTALLGAAIANTYEFLPIGGSAASGGGGGGIEHCLIFMIYSINMWMGTDSR